MFGSETQIGVKSRPRCLGQGWRELILGLAANAMFQVDVGHCSSIVDLVHFEKSFEMITINDGGIGRVRSPETIVVPFQSGMFAQTHRNALDSET